jgi:hypothetical protein
MFAGWDQIVRTLWFVWAWQLETACCGVELTSSCIFHVVRSVQLLFPWGPKGGQLSTIRGDKRMLRSSDRVDKRFQRKWQKMALTAALIHWERFKIYIYVGFRMSVPLLLSGRVKSMIEPPIEARRTNNTRRSRPVKTTRRKGFDSRDCRDLHPFPTVWNNTGTTARLFFSVFQVLIPVNRTATPSLARAPIEYDSKSLDPKKRTNKRTNDN